MTPKPIEVNPMKCRTVRELIGDLEKTRWQITQLKQLEETISMLICKNVEFTHFLVDGVEVWTETISCKANVRIAGDPLPDIAEKIIET